MATSPFLAVTLSNNKVIEVQIPIRLTSETTNLLNTTGLSNEHILGLYITRYERLAETTPPSINWRYRNFKDELEEVRTILRDGGGRKELLGQSVKFLARCREEKYRW